MRVLITGANGFIGNKLIDVFLNNGYIVEGWDLFKSNYKNVKIEKIDMNSEEELLFNLGEYKPDIIIHCAGCADVRKSVLNPCMDYQGNVTLTHKLLFAIHKLHLKSTRFIFLSSAAVYGTPILLPISEDTPINPLSPYALHKVMCEDICNYFIRNYGMDIRVARIFSTYGKGLRKQIFWDMYNKLEKTGCLNMFGTGNESRDYIHVEDVAQTLFLLATTQSSNVIFNVANGEEITIRNVAELFAECAGISKDKILFDNCVREGDPLNWKADISRLVELGYHKTVDLTTGIKEYYEWVSHK